MKIHPLLPGTLLGLLLFCCATTTSVSAAPNHRVVQLEEAWRIGGEDDEETLLGVVDQALADDQGNLYLLDIQLLEVQVYAADGSFVQALGRQGDGPGEFRRAGGLLFLPDGTLGIIQRFPGKIVKLDLNGLPAGEIRPGGEDPAAGGFFALQQAAARGDRVVVSGARMSRQEDRRTAVHFIAPFQAGAGIGQPFLEQTTVREFQSRSLSEKEEFFPHQGGWALGPAGRVFIATSRNDYLIEVYTPDGQLEQTLQRDYESLPRTDLELAQAQERLIPSRRRNRRSLTAVMEPTERDILKMRVDSQGRLWVLTSRGIKYQPAGIHSTWDVFDPQGKFEETVALACEGRGARDTLFFAGGKWVVLVKEHADAMQAFRGQGQNDDTADEPEARPLEIVVYRLPGL